MLSSVLCILLWSGAVNVAAHTISPRSIHARLHDTQSGITERSIISGIQLRVLSLGASVVYGLESSDGNGFRRGIRDQLTCNGNPVNMIGSQKAGNMTDNDVEAWPGFEIDQIAEKAELSIPSQPNLVLMHLGSNDCWLNNDIPNIGSRLGKLIDRLFDAIPGVTIIASTLLPNGYNVTQANSLIFNSQIPDVVKTRQEAGRKITYVDFAYPHFVMTDLGPDGTHPTDTGYLKMASFWYQGVQLASSKGWITPPANVSGVFDNVTETAVSACEKAPAVISGLDSLKPALAMMTGQLFWSQLT